MSRFKPFRRRRRSPTDGKFMPKDDKAWRALLKAVRYQVRAPLACADPLTAAAERTFRAVVPPSARGPASDFLRLNLLARGFGKLADDERQARAPELAALADRVQAVLDKEMPPSPGGRPPRADIFG